MKTLLFPKKTTSLAGLLVAPIVLAGCAGTPPPKTTISPQQKALDHSIASISKVSSSLRTADKHYKGFPLPGTDRSAPHCSGVNPNSPLSEPLTIQWSGKVSTLLQGLASRWGWSFENRLGSGQHDPDVSVYTHHVKAIDVLDKVAKQTPKSTVIRVKSGMIVLEGH